MALIHDELPISTFSSSITGAISTHENCSVFMVGHLPWSPHLLSLQKADVLFDAQSHVPQELAEEGPNDDL